MRLSTLIALGAILGVVATVSAQAGPVKGRTFTYTATDSVNSDFSKSGNVTLKSVSTVTVDPYLYITGNLSANWTIDGWGVGTDNELNSIYFYHNETLTLQMAQFDNPAKVSGTQTGDQTVQLNGEVAIYNNGTGVSLFDTGLLAISKLNALFQASGPNFGAAQTGGVMRVDFSRQILLTPSTGPGVYQNVGTITVMRN